MDLGTRHRGAKDAVKVIRLARRAQHLEVLHLDAAFILLPAAVTELHDVPAASVLIRIIWKGEFTGHVDVLDQAPQNGILSSSSTMA